MSLTEFINNLAAKNIELWVEGDKLYYDAPEDALTPELLGEIKQYKAEIIKLLSDGDQATSTYPLSQGQKALWFLDQLAPQSVAYHLTYTAKLAANVDIFALKQAAQVLVDRHPVLRTTFATVDSEPVQTIHANQQVDFSIEEVSDFAQDDVDNWVAERSDRLFDLEQGPIVRFDLLINQTTSNQAATEHILLITLHHIIGDFWSLEILINELRALYQAIAKGIPHQLPAAKYQYQDYVNWSEQMLASSEGDRLWNYWQKQLSGELPLLNLPTDRPRPENQTYNGTNQFFALDEQLLHQLTELAKQQGASLYTVVLTALQILLLRYTNQEDILIGSPMVNRSRSEFEKIIGYFTNPVVLRADLSGNPTFEELLERSRACVLNALDHQEYPFPLLVERLQPVRDPSYSPIYQVALAWDRSHQNDQEALLTESDELIVESMPGSRGAIFDLTLTILDEPGSLKGTWNYNTDLFDSSTIERMAVNFVTLLESIVTNPQERICQLPILTQAEQQQLLVQWNHTHTDYPQDKCIHQLFEEQVERTPDAVAVVCENQQLTYHELNSRADSLAHYLRSLGVGADVLVGICVERSLEMVVGLLAILKAGGAYVPLDPEYPQDRLSFMLADTQVSVLLTQEKLVQSLGQHQAQVVCLDKDWENIAQANQHPLNSIVSAENLCYVIYTSGSTGTPKGVVVTHQSVNRLVCNTNYIQFTPDDCVAQASNIAFDAATFEIWGALLHGGKLVIISKSVLLNPQEFAAYLHSYQISVLFLTTALFNQLASFLPQAFSSLKYLLFGGEAVDPKWVQEVLEKGAPQQLLHVYGPTENTTFSSWYLVEELPTTATTIPIGRPISNTQIYILDQYLQPVPVGVAGELHIGGAGLARGYLNRPELTQAKFIPNPFDNSKLYKTGDLVRYLPDGNIEYIGRIDNQVKIRGFRIELGEIEAILNQHEAVQTNCVIVREDTRGEKRLVAYIVSASEVKITTSELRSFLKQKLPDYMIPSGFVFLEALPLTPNGKIDRRALPTPEIDSEQVEKYVAPRTPTEELLALIWQEVLKLERVGREDNFFELGGHSLLATQIVSRIRTNFQIELPLRSLFAAPTIAGIASIIGQLQQQDLALAAPPILKRTENADLPLSFAQQRLWFLDQYETNSSYYNIPIGLRLVGNLNVAALETSLEAIIHRHEALRTNFITIDGQATQVIQAQTNWLLEVVDLQHLSAQEIEIAAQKITQQQALTPFDLAGEPLIRVKLLLLSDTEQWLLVCMHHIVSDGWSMSVFVQELQALYNAYSQNQQSPLLPLPIQYADFAIWQRLWLQGDVLNRQLSYWKQQLASAQTFLPLPTDRPRPAVQTFNGAYLEFALSAELTQKLEKLSNQQGVTLFMTLLAAYNTLLYRYTGQEDILVGTPIANRDRTDIEGLIGFFVNTLVMRTDLSANSSFSELLWRIRSIALSAYAHQDLPFEMLVEALQPERDLSHTPLFQVMFSLQNDAPISQVQLSGLTVSSLPIASKTAKFDLTLGMENTANGLCGWWEYNTDLFDSSTIERMNGHFLTLLEAIVAHPEERIAQLPILTQSEQQQLLFQWQDTQLEYGQDKCIHQLFEEQVERTPDAVAVVFENQSLTYQELNCRANSLAHHLRLEGVGADILVGLSVERSLEMVIGILGILKAGGAYLPLDPEYPSERLAFMLEDAQVSVLLTQQHLVEKLPAHQAQLVCIDSEYPHTPANLLDVVKPANLAYVIYTSGSTGKPKGVLVNHSNVTRLFAATDAWYNFSAADVWTLFHSYAFDFSVWEIWGALLYGGRLVVVPYLVTRSPESFYELLCTEKVTVLNQTPSAFRQLIAAEQSKETIGDINLRLVIFGGEALEPKTLQPWFERHGDELPQLVNMYGITETTVHVTYRPITQADVHGGASVIGCPIPDLQVYVLDQYHQVVPVGVPGEMYVGGAGVTSGYLNRAELTAQRFIPHPFDENSAQRLYKTGDLARYLPNGELEYLGRIDQQVKIRGFRIELGEIEALLLQHPTVRESVVIVREDQPGDKRLVAYLVPQGEESPKASELRAFLKQKLPDYMIPGAFVHLDAFPLTVNGKLDRRALPTPEIDSEYTEKYVAPRTPTEELLALIWQQVLKLERVGREDNFFELGGHSLLATQIVSRIRTNFQVELPLRSLFAAPTIAEIASIIGQLQQQDLALAAPPILKRTENADLPLSFAQQRLWFLDQFETNSSFYNIPIGLRLVGNLNVAALEASLETIIQRHEALRTNFISIDGKATQVIQAQTNWTLEVVDLQHLSAQEIEIAAQELAQQQALTPFDLAGEPLIRVKLLLLSPTEQWLSVCMHHVVSDAWSMGVFVDELSTLYNAYSQNQPSPLLPLPIQYADFAIWQRQWLQGEVLDKQLSYWQQQLASAPTFLPLPTDRPRPAVQTFNGTYLEFALSAELTQQLEKLSNQQGVTLFMTLLAAYNTLLYRYTGQEDILVGSPIANRDRSEVEGLIGFFVNTLVMRGDLSQNPSFSELLWRIRSMALSAYAHQDLPFEMLVEALQPERDLSHTPLFQVMFSLQNDVPISQVQLSGLTVSSLPIKLTTSRFDLTLIMQNSPTGLVGLWEYSTDLFDASTIERMTSHFVTLLEDIVANPQQNICQLPLLTQTEQQNLLVEWNDTFVDYPQDKVIHQLFEAQVERTPDAVAVIFENQSLTYHQLNSSANSLANYLRSAKLSCSDSLGVKPDTLVGICVERSLEMVIGILGILKAGGAYLPLDPEYPTERLAFMLEDAAVSVLLTQQKLVEKLPQHQARVVNLDSDWQDINQMSQENIISGVQAHNLGYVIYTSGSTGQPKGVAMNQIALCNLILWQLHNSPMSSQGVKTLQFAPVSFDVSFQEMFTTWCSGGTLLLIDEQLRRDSLALLKLLQQQAVERLYLPFVALQQLAEVAVSNEIVTSHLREIITAGEQLQITPAIANWLSGLRDCTLHNHYGPSESHVVATYTLTPPVDNWAALPPIGRPIANTQIYILDQYLQPVPVGVPGELHIGGVSLARGYLNRPELTEEKFIPNPFRGRGAGEQGSKGEDRLYKTGDLVRYLADGNIEYLGRIDNQVKIRGFRIELGEIEAVLSQYQLLQANCVIVREESMGDKRLVAYIVPQPEQTVIVSELRQFLKSQLPEYMVPAAIVTLDALPLTPSGKVNRRALPAPELSSEISETYVAPRTPIEEILVLIWQQVLKVEPIGREDNFFELGGHSLLATQIVSRIRTNFQVELPLRSLFAAPTIAGIASIIGQLQQQDLALVAPPILQRTENADLPLSFAQQRLWFLDQFQPNSSLYNIPFGLRLVGTVDVAALEQSLREIIHRHETLRTNFVTVDGQPRQIIQTLTNWQLAVVDLQHLSASEQATTAQQLLQQQAIQTFDLGSDALIRATLLVLSQTEQWLSVCMHHVVSDGWSMGVFVDELTALYNAYSQNQQSPLLPLPIQYADFAIWQRQWLQGEVLDKQLSYWKQQLASAQTFLPLPTDRPRPAVQTFNGTYLEFALSAELTQKLEKLSTQQGVTMFMTLLAAYNTLLYRYTGQEDILVGTPIANRDRTDIEGLIGFFVNTLVMRSDLSQNPSFSELLSRIRSMALSAYAHQDLPFEMLVEALQPERDLSHTPLFQVMFALQNAPISEVQLSGLTVSSLPIASKTAKFDLTLAMQNTATGLIGWWEYNTDLFDSSTIERMNGHFLTLLEAIVAHPEAQIAQLPILTQSQQQQLLFPWQDTQLDYGQDKCIHQLFEEQVELTPDAVAVVFENESLTYYELNCRANSLANYLRLEGVGADILVGLSVERSLEMVVGILGILKAGGAYLPLDPEYPSERLAFMLEDAQVSVLLTQQHLVEKLPAHQAQLVCIDSEYPQYQSNLLDVVKPTNLAYVIYTSGSTGKPKGVLVNHSNVTRLFAATDAWYNFSAADVWTLFHSYAFDFSVWEIWGALLYGGRLVVVPYLVTRSPESFYELLCTEKVTVLNQTPSAFRQLIAAEQSKETIGDIKLRLVIFGGEALEPKTLQPWFERHGDTSPQLVNMYGITETTVHVTYRPITQADVHGGASVIGCPIPDLQVYVLDQYHQVVPVGVPGEMYVGGAGVTRGYLNREELTAQRFIPHPFDENSAQRLYKTGDLARYLPNGELEYLGRIDQQVKIRGFRIELGEIEALLLQHHSVRESVVIVREDQPGDKRLVAYLVSQGEELAKASELRAFLKQKLPDYMIPSAFVHLDAFPLTVNGKLDRAALKPPSSTRAELEDDFVAPSTTKEKILAAIWAKVLGVEQVGIHDNFFALGGDSIRSIQVLAAAKEQGLNFSVQQLFQHQTIHGLVQELETQGQNLTKSQLTQPFSLICEADKQKLPDGIEDAYPLAMLQMGMLYHTEYNKDSAVYREISSFHFQAPLDVEQLQAALQDLAERHPILRTSFALSNYTIPLQLVHQQVKIPLLVEDWCHLNYEQQEAALVAWFEVEKQQHFDWNHPPLIRFFVHRRTQESFNLTLSCHHAILDGWSVASMMSELLGRYLSRVNAAVDYVSPPLSLAFRDFVDLEQQALADAATQDYWSHKLSDSTFTKLPRWSPVSKNTGVTPLGVQEVTLSPEICQGLKQFAQLAEVPLKTVLLAAHLRVLNLLGGNSDVLTGLVANGRPEQSDGDRILGLFLNTLPLRCQLSGGTWLDLVQQVFRSEREMLPHRRYPLAQIQRNLGGQPLFETAFNFVHFHVYQQLMGLDNLQLLGGKFFEETNFTFTAQFGVDPASSQIELKLQYDATELSALQMQRIGDYYFKALVAMVNQPQERYESYSLLSEAEQQQLLFPWHDTHLEYSQDKCIHQLFEEQVERSPNAVAVVFENESLTYQELNNRANSLAHYLRSLGVGADVLVGLSVERSLEMVVGILGILKAGGAYLPLDPEYPPERLSFMLEDAQVRVIVTQQHLIEKLPAHQAQLVCIDSEYPQYQSNLLDVVKPTNLAYVIYTSGSTGKPKGVLVNHSNVTRLFAATDAWYNFSAADVWTLFHSYAFDFSVWEIWGALLYGGRLVVVPYLVTRSPESFYQLLCTEKVTVLNQTPSAFRQLIAAEQARENIGDINLRLVIFGGEALEPKTLQPWFERHGDELPQLVNMYGITETTVHVTYRPISFADVDGGASVIGRPIPDLQVYVLDQYHQVVPVGVPGEMYVGGAGVTRGYLHRPELTAQRFIPHPVDHNSGQLLYKTGDLARYLPNGELEYLGRIDQQVKIRGFRIELGEIEALLLQHPAVRESVVIVREDQPGDKRLVAYLVPQGEESPKASELRAFLEQRLPDYMIPSAFMFLEALPLTVNGKLNRAALPAINTARPELEDDFVAPSTTEEKILAAIWAKVLGVEQVGIHDNFFALGGDSIRSIQVLSAAKEQGWNFSIQQLFQHQTIHGLLQELKMPENEMAKLELAQPFSLISAADKQKLPAGIEDAYPLAMLQMGMLYHTEFSKDTAIYHDIFSYYLKTPLDVELLQVAIQDLVQYHPILRTSFDPSNFSVPLQLVHQRVEVPLQVEDWCHLNDSEQEAALVAWFEVEKQQHFDWNHPPLIRFFVHRRTQESFNLTLSFHHAILDGWSVASMMSELLGRYLSRVNAAVDYVSPPLSINFRDFVDLEQQALASSATQDYWSQKLSDCTFTKLPRWSPVSKNTGVSKLGLQAVSLSPEISEGLKQFAQLAEVPLKTVLLAAHLRVLSLLGGNSDVLTGVVANGRPEQSDGDRILGLFLNTLPFRCQLSGGTWLDLVQQVFRSEREMLPHRRYPLAEIQRNLGGQPLFETAFNFVHFHAYDKLLGLDNLQLLGGKFFEETNFTFSAQFSVNLASSQIELTLQYDATELSAPQINKIGEYYFQALVAMVNQPQKRYELHSLLSEAEQQQLLIEWNDTQVEYPQDKCIHQLFEEQVERTPDAVAVIFDNQKLTYHELNCRANQLAHYLKSLGVKPDVLVGICVKRSLEMIVGILGILKAGGAYVPLDSKYPSERLAFMLEDAQVSVLVTQQALLYRLPEHQAQLDFDYAQYKVCLDTDAEAIAQFSQDNPISNVQATDLAYVIYTSGSTGKPKGVMIEHCSLVNFTKVEQVRWSMSQKDAVLQFSSFSFDVFAKDVYPCLTAGGTLVLRTEQMLDSWADFVEGIQRWQITIMNLPTAYWHELITELAQTNKSLSPSLRLITVGGEQLLPEKVKLWYEYLEQNADLDQLDTPPQLVNGYGPTETTIQASCYALSTDMVAATLSSVPIGRPLPNTQIYILDSNLQPVPVGVPGELHIGGAGLARGYFNRPELTAEKFIPNPFNNSKLYKTGDLARYLPDGNIEYLGRIDGQVKIRGFRIELGEIEAVLSQHPGVRETVLIARESIPGNKQLVAYVVPLQEEAPTMSDLRLFLKQRVPDYMVPDAFVVLESLPLTPNGKVDRRALPAPDLHLELKQSFVAPRTPIEEMLARIWAESLKIDKVGVQDNFFEMGGHSLKATQVISQVRKALKIELPLRSLFDNPTVAELAATIAAKLENSPTIVGNTQQALNADAILDPAIQPHLLSFTYTREPQSIFLTGATGFLGGYLLYELLEQTQADIYCLVRAADEQQAKQKVQSQMVSCQLWRDVFSSRIIPILGDLSKPLLGLSPSQFQDLASKIDIIYHNGAWVNAVYPYSVLKAANVLGTQEVLRLASEIKLKPVHHISTMSVFGSPAYSQATKIWESDPLEHSEDINSGYSESKWVAEKLVMSARDRGLPVSIYRSCRIIGHTQTGVCNPDDLLSRFIPGCIQLGMVPKLDGWQENVIPIDYMSRAIIHLSQQQESLGKAFHLVNPRPTLMSNVFNCIRALGYRLEEVSFPEWRSHLIRTNQESANPVLQSLLAIVGEQNIESDSQEKAENTNQPPEFDLTNTLAGLAGTDIVFPAIEEKFIQKYLADFIIKGLVPNQIERKN
ncbi:non-ribosomal peptide synthase/polyketide synthase [Nostoc sp. FACHB-110]|uniref:non-ribosomal peptide synthase/polyketide synthase n=1 Tax=Nostoc sp. FACHB-110 TaxID=2692834 RepID=UPI00168A24B7|nr:non-ribosomal peptide synthase/polyketide synthase [Nostoc sp. FACHB-110]MBD2438978.1 non-ribosomal peptide synthase/polyketide synthase [Nostoc sp. FACHB-110]